MNRERLERIFLELCRIPSPSRREGSVAAYIRRRLEGAGYRVEEDGAGPALGSDTGNLIVRTPRAGEEDDPARGGRLPRGGEPARGTSHPGAGQPAQAASHPEAGEPARGTSHPGAGEPARGTSHPGAGEPAQAASHPGASEPARGDRLPGAGQSARGTSHPEAGEPARGTHNPGAGQPARGTSHPGAGQPAQAASHPGASEPARGDRLPGAGQSARGTLPSEPGEPVPGRPEPIFLSAHMDTVPVPEVQEIPVAVTGGVAQTDGSSILGGDDKAGVAVAMELLESWQEGMRPVEVAFTVQEELGARGAAFLDLAAFRSTWGFNLDGEGPVYSAIRRAPSKYRYAVRITGRRSHAAVEPGEGRNALLAAAEVALKLPQGLLDRDSTGNVAAIEGGGATNIVPGEALIRGEVRSLRPERLRELIEGIERAADLATYREGTSATVEWEHLYDGYELTEADPPVRAFLDACAALTGDGGTLMESKGGGDANPINNRGISVIVFGLGMENIHTTEERMELKNLSLATALLERILRE